MRFATVWNSLRVLAIMGLGSRLLFYNILYTVSFRRALFDLTQGRPELGTSEAQEKLERIQDTSMEVEYINSWVIPMLVIVALSPYLRKKTKRTSAEERGGSGQSAGTSART